MNVCVSEEGVNLAAGFLSEGVCNVKNGSCLPADVEEGEQWNLF